MLRFISKENQETGRKEIVLNEQTQIVVDTIAAMQEPTNADVVYMQLLILEILTGRAMPGEGDDK